jgi:hypothetical protein
MTGTDMTGTDMTGTEQTDADRADRHETIHETVHRRRRSTMAAAVAAVGALVWFTHLSVTYALVPDACRRGSVAWLLAVSAGGLAAGAGTVIVASRAHAPVATSSRLDRARAIFGRTDDDRRRTTGAAIALTVYFTFVVLLTTLVPILGGPCA